MSDQIAVNLAILSLLHIMWIHEPALTQLVQCRCRVYRRGKQLGSFTFWPILTGNLIAIRSLHLETFRRARGGRPATGLRRFGGAPLDSPVINRLPALMIVAAVIEGFRRAETTLRAPEAGCRRFGQAIAER